MDQYLNNKIQLTIISGPIKSGKSKWAEVLLSGQNDVTYFATSEIYPSDKSWQERINLHRARRPKSWKLIETCKDLYRRLPMIHASKYVLIDSLGGFITHGLQLDSSEWNQISEFFISQVLSHKGSILIVIEEVGWSLIPPSASGHLFIERLGELSLKLQKFSSQSWLVVQGHAIDLKTSGKSVL